MVCWGAITRTLVVSDALCFCCFSAQHLTEHRDRKENTNNCFGSIASQLLWGFVRRRRRRRTEPDRNSKEKSLSFLLICLQSPFVALSSSLLTSPGWIFGCETFHTSLAGGDC